MKIALCSSYVPFIRGGYRNIVEWLELVLLEEGHQVEKIYLPEIDTPNSLFQQMMAFRWVDLGMADRIVCFRPQAHLIYHPHKIVWFIHHIRMFYDLWDTPYREFPDDVKNRGFRDALRAVDNAGLREAKKIFTNSRVVSNRLKTYNNVQSEILYPPVSQPERFRCSGFNDEIVCVCRMEHHKRQHLLIEAMRYTKTKVKLHLAGTSSGSGYPKDLMHRIKKWGLSSRIIVENCWISEEKKVELLANSLAIAYLPLDEDSYGYPCIEASHSSKPILTTSDSGGVLELVEDSIHGYVTEPIPEAIGGAMDKLYIDRKKTATMGENARHRLSELDISWNHVLEKLLA